MSRRAKGSYTLIDNPAVAYAKQRRDASVSVLMVLAERDNFTHLPAAVRVPEIMLETGLGQRAVEKCLARLQGESLAAPHANGWAYSGANSRANREANGGANDRANEEANDRANGGSQNQEQNTVPDEENPALKELEGIRKEVEDKKNPPTPQGAEAQNSTAPVVIAEPETQQVTEQPEQHSPDGEAADAATAAPSVPVQENTDTGTEGQEKTATDNKNVPPARRRAAAPKFDPLALSLPECVSADLWAEWVAHRADIRKPLTQAAAVLTLKGLETAHGNSWIVTDLVHEAIAGRWTGCVFDKHRQPNPRPAHIVQFPTSTRTSRPNTVEEANHRFVANMAGHAAAIRGVFDD